MTRDGKQRVGRHFDKTGVRQILTDRRYLGLQVLGEETFRGEHPGIVKKATFNQVQRILEENRRAGGSSSRNKHSALLRGILRCAACDASMTHTFTNHRKKAFRYYGCTHTITNGADACPTGSVSAAKIEKFVVEQIRRIGCDPHPRGETFHQVQAQVAAERRGSRPRPSGSNVRSPRPASMSAG